MVVRGLLVVGLLVGTLATATGTRAAFEVVVLASPAEARIGQPVEVLIRTFVPVPRDVLGVPDPREPFPGSSGLWNVLYPMAEDYPFDVVAAHEDGSEVPVTVDRDPSDATLWRGMVSLPKAGTWTIQVRNFQGATTVVQAHVGSVVSIEASLGAAVGVLVGLLGGVIIGRGWRRHSPS